MLLTAVQFLQWPIEMAKFAFLLGSSKHGNAFLASIGSNCVTANQLKKKMSRVLLWFFIVHDDHTPHRVQIISTYTEFHSSKPIIWKIEEILFVSIMRRGLMNIMVMEFQRRLYPGSLRSMMHITVTNHTKQLIPQKRRIHLSGKRAALRG